MRRSRICAAPVAAALLALAGCAGADSGVSVGTSAPRQDPAPPSTAPGGPPTTQPAGHGPGASTLLAWEPCDDADGWECATLTVPLVHVDPAAGTTDLALTRRVAADPANRIGSLVVNPGGPGASGIEAARYLDADLDQRLVDRFDLVGFDPRGVGASDGVDCIADEAKDDLLALDPTPDGEEEIDARLDLEIDAASGCAESLGDVLPHLGTQAAARDLDLVREALGDEQLTYLGFSYGTALGAAYAQLFPERVRALVLDGPVSPGGEPSGKESDGAGPYGDQDFEGAFERFADACASSDECPLEEDATTLIEDLYEQVEEGPLPAGAADADRPVGPGLLDLGVAAPLYDTATWPMLAIALRDAAGGDGSLLQRLADVFVGRGVDGTWTDELDARQAVACADVEERPTRDEVRDAYVRLYLDEEDVPVWPLEDCLGWPASAEPLPDVSAADTGPLLVVGTVGDPATPYENAAAMAEALGSGVVLTYEGDGHTAFGRSACIDEAVTDYLLDVTVPTGDATTCPAEGAESAGGAEPADGLDGGEPVYAPLDRAQLREDLELQLVDLGTPEEYAACYAEAVTTELSEEQLVYGWLAVSLAGVDARLAELASGC